MLDMEQMSRRGGGNNSRMCTPIGRWLMKLKAIRLTMIRSMLKTWKFGMMNCVCLF
jgi:hypothetical protein